MFRESPYRRPLVQRLTAPGWFVLALAGLGLFLSLSALVIRAREYNAGTEMLSERLGETPASIAAPSADSSGADVMPLEAAGTAVAEAAAQPEISPDDPGPVPVPPPTATPTPTLALAPTGAPAAQMKADPNQAAWAAQLKPQTDGSLLAPRDVVAKATADLGSYYAMQLNLPLDDYLARRDEILDTYFTGEALDKMRQTEDNRAQYAVKRAGRTSIVIRHFSADGLTAKAGVITRGWTSDVYDIASKELVAKDQASTDTLTVMTIVFDKASGRWKFAAVDEIVEAVP
jgi:hypothetical protein